MVNHQRRVRRRPVLVYDGHCVDAVFGRGDCPCGIDALVGEHFIICVDRAASCPCGCQLPCECHVLICPVRIRYSQRYLRLACRRRFFDHGVAFGGFCSAVACRICYFYMEIYFCPRGLCCRVGKCILSVGCFAAVVRGLPSVYRRGPACGKRVLHCFDAGEGVLCHRRHDQFVVDGIHTACLGQCERGIIPVYFFDCHVLRDDLVACGHCDGADAVCINRKCGVGIFQALRAAVGKPDGNRRIGWSFGELYFPAARPVGVVCRGDKLGQRRCGIFRCAKIKFVVCVRHGAVVVSFAHYMEIPFAACASCACPVAAFT